MSTPIDMLTWKGESSQASSLGKELWKTKEVKSRKNSQQLKKTTQIVYPMPKRSDLKKYL